MNGAATQRLIDYIAANGPVSTIRASSNRRRDWGIARYEIRIVKRGGYLSNVVTHGMGSDRYWTFRAVKKLAHQIAKSEGRIFFVKIGKLTEDDANYILMQLGCLEQSAE